MLFRAGQHITGLYEVTSGTVRLARVDPKWRETVLYVGASGEMLAEASLFASASRAGSGLHNRHRTYDPDHM
ncbi:cyclic nucleotide-binding domain-containing protein [Bradyrhizobium symbiodeficiens]|uniref:cyclic nucleotide-binding domain-containing protein n=1 Tax=Bradyrhizobium symbiodeficiens TaxID=1404367 RepID=UPI001391AD4B|nr:cyclic nucleotide-binding domain-containing protein [Bradyrhizobium sp. 192]